MPTIEIIPVFSELIVDIYVLLHEVYYQPVTVVPWLGVAIGSDLSARPLGFLCYGFLEFRCSLCYDLLR